MRLFVLLFAIYSSVACSHEYELSPSGGDDTLSFQAAFLLANIAHDTIRINSGTYTITGSMPEIVNAVVIYSPGRAVINLSNVDQFITIGSVRATEIRGLRIDGSDNSNGILAHDGSWLRLRDIELVNMNIAIELDYQHDSNFTNIKFYSNNIDLLAEKRQVTSIKVTDSHFELSNYAVKYNASVTNFVFRDCGFAPIGIDNPIQITNATFNGVFDSNRFENKSLANGIYINGQSHTYPAQTIVITNNYFSGKLINGIVLGNRTNHNTVTNNHFQTNPVNTEILDETDLIRVNTITNNYSSIHLTK